jgi:hypothetical protein
MVCKTTITNKVWEPPTVKQALLNQRSPWQLQCPLVHTPPSDKSIRMRMSDTLASNTAMLTSRGHHNSESTSNSTRSRLHQQSLVLIRPAGLTIWLACCGKNSTQHPASSHLNPPGSSPPNSPFTSTELPRKEDRQC